MNYSSLEHSLKTLEGCWQSRIPSYYSVHNPDPKMVNGCTQFFAVDNSRAGRNLPVVVCCGSNYHQSTTVSAYNTCYLGTPAGPVAVNDSLTTMRSCLMHLFHGYSMAKREWFENMYASSSSIRPPGDFHLVAVNFCPFITLQRWQKYGAGRRASLLSVAKDIFAPVQDLRHALQTVDDGICLWVAHGLDSPEVPVLFRIWQAKSKVDPWLITSNLGYRYVCSKGTPFWLRL